MSPLFFREQWLRLVTRFGIKAMDDEFKRLCALEVNTMSESAFKRFVDVTIGSRTSTRPPLVTDFREARLAEEKQKFQNDLHGASRFLRKGSPAEMRKHMHEVLSKEFGGVDSIGDALEIARLKITTGGSN